METTADIRRPYEPPRLVTIGPVEELTGQKPLGLVQDVPHDPIEIDGRPFTS